MWPNPQLPVDLVTFTEEFLMKKIIFCVVIVTHTEFLLCIKTTIIHKMFETNSSFHTK